MFSLSPEEWTAVELSLRIAVVATVVSLPFGIAVAWLLARKDFWGKALLDGVVHLPLVLPPVVTGYLLLITFGRKGAVGSFLADIGIVFSFRWTGAALACGVMAFPLLVRAIRLSFEAIDRRLEDAASTLGANGIWAFLTVTLPLALPGILAGTILCFILAMNAYATPFLLGGPLFKMMAPLVYNQFTQQANWPFGGAIAFILMSVTLSLTLIANLLIQRRSAR